MARMEKGCAVSQSCLLCCFAKENPQHPGAVQRAAELLPCAIHSQLTAPRAPHNMGIAVCSSGGGCPCSPPSPFQHSPPSPAGLGRGGGGLPLPHLGVSLMNCSCHSLVSRRNSS